MNDAGDNVFRPRRGGLSHGRADGAPGGASGASGRCILTAGAVTVRLLALDIEPHGGERYRVSFRPAPMAPFRAGWMRHAGDGAWSIAPSEPGDGSEAAPITAVFGSPDDVFRLALGEPDGALPGAGALVAQAAPSWPPPLTARLARRRLAGAGTIAFDPDWFIAELATSTFDRPLLFPGATARLELAGLDQASAILRCCAQTSAAISEGESDHGDRAFARLLLRAIRDAPPSLDTPAWDGEGRLIGEFPNGALAQVGTDITDGCQAVLGDGLLRVRFEPHEPLGVGLGPLVFREDAPSDDDASVGMGLEVGEVDAGGAAERAGVDVGMVVAGLCDPDLAFGSGLRCRMTFEAALEAIDARRAAGTPVVVAFDTSAPVDHLYAVEMPAAATLTALGAAAEAAVDALDVDAGAALNAASGGALLWREDTPRLFFGAAGSSTAAHRDICPQLEVAHGVYGTKLLGVASHEATPRLSEEHARDEGGDDGATRVPTDRPLVPRESSLLGDPDVTVVLLQEGDLAAFHSGALHFASNSADGRNAALYHGAMTRALLPRLRAAASQTVTPASGDAYRHHLHPADLLHLIEATTPK